MGTAPSDSIVLLASLALSQSIIAELVNIYGIKLLSQEPKWILQLSVYNTLTANWVFIISLLVLLRWASFSMSSVIAIALL